MLLSPFSLLTYLFGESRRKILLLAGIIFSFGLSFIVLHSHDNFKDLLNHQKWQNLELVVHSGLKSLPAQSLKDVRNATLGFEKVYAINLPGRTDKLDAMRLTAALTGFNFDIINGVKGEDIPIKSLPGTFREQRGRYAIIGCWRAHMDFAHTIIKNRISTALAFEDDADWDVGFRRQLEDYALGSQHILNSINGPTPHSPYGDGWDLLWLGHCASAIDKDDRRRFVIKNDPTVTPPKHRTNFGLVPDMSRYDNTTRIMFANKGGVCLYAYALSYRGAQKVLSHLSMSLYASPVDFGISDMCKRKNFKCVGIFPQIVDCHRGPGNSTKDSDISRAPAVVRTRGFSYNIVHSTRLNVDHLIDQEMDQIENQWQNEMTPLEGPVELSWEEISS